LRIEPVYSKPSIPKEPEGDNFMDYAVTIDEDKFSSIENQE
jgi:hypothetical protein